MVTAGQFALFCRAQRDNTRPTPGQPVERAEQEHEVASIAELQAGLFAEAREVGAVVAAQVMRQLIVETPELLEGRGGDKQQPAGLDRGARLTQGLQVVGQVLNHVQKEGDIPVIAPAQVHQVDLVALDTRGQDAAGHAQGRARGVGQGQWLVLPGSPVVEVAHPSADPTPEVHGRQASAVARAMAVEGMEQEPVPAAIPEVTLLHGPEGGEAVLGIFVVAVLDGGGGLVDAVVGVGVGAVHYDWVLIL